MIPRAVVRAVARAAPVALSAAPCARAGAARAAPAAVGRGAVRALSAASAAAPPGGANPPIIRFISDDGQEYFGAFTDGTEQDCYIATRGRSGLRLSTETRKVDIILAPVDPPAVYCIGLNYADHAAEVKAEPPRFPVVFMKPVTALTGHRNAIVIPRVASDPPEVDYEAELAVVIGREAKDVAEKDAMDYVLGYTIANDVTARRWQGKRGGGQWIRGKGFDTFLPLGPALVPKADVPDPHNLKIQTTINDTLVQDGHTSSMMFRIPALISFLSQGTTLLPGTVILTGTPAGVGYTRGLYLKKGDVVAVHIERLGTLRNTVAQDIGDGLLEH
jgi:2-keto-4-pentenoate hydratase/2-oxohepta-3-ene-1,7-dioic acid hydratase in catechol pathway